MVILIGFVSEKDGNYYLQVFLKECKYNEKVKVIQQGSHSPGKSWKVLEFE